MKLPKEISNGFLIFTGIGLYFLLMKILGLADLFYLRIFNILFVFYGVNRTLQMNRAENKTEFAPNAVSALFTALIGVLFSVIGLLITGYIQGGDAYIHSLSEVFLFGETQSLVTYCICILFEGIASSVVVTLFLMLYHNNDFVTD